MTKSEIAALPKGTKLFILSRRVSRSGMRESFDVFFVGDNARREPKPEDIRLSWIRIADYQGRNEAKDFNKSKKVECHAAGDIDSERKHGGNFWVNGCGFDRVAAVAESLGSWACDDSRHFTFQCL